MQYSIQILVPFLLQDRGVLLDLGTPEQMNKFMVSRKGSVYTIKNKDSGSLRV